MLIRKEDYEQVLDYLVKQREEGHEFIAFDNGAVVDSNELITFSNQVDAQVFCYEMTTDLDTFHYLSIRSAGGAMEEGLTDNSLMVEKDGLVDVGIMCIQRYQRLQAKQLNDHHSKPPTADNQQPGREQHAPVDKQSCKQENAKTKLGPAQNDRTGLLKLSKKRKGRQHLR